ncbi:MAG: acyl carrier protein [Kineosporiaceae bacterium]
MSTETLTPEAAREAVAAALRRVVPDADLGSCPPDVNLREEFELDSLDWLEFVETLAKRAGRRIDEDDYASLQTLDASVDFLTRPGR